jgi:HK97 family phage portal protein
MANILTTTRLSIANWLSPEKKISDNVFNQAFFQQFGSGWTRYDTKGQTYLDKGYNENPDVFSIVSQIARKFSSVPGVLKEVKDKKALKQLKKLYVKSLSPQETLLKCKLETKAFTEDGEEIDEPLDRPNYYQSETEFKELWETFMLLTGNAYQWMLRPSDGANQGVPLSRFLLPSHLVQIVLKENANINDLDNPISHYIILLGNSMIRFERDDIIHSKFPNPNYDLNGSHLYGQSPLRSALRDIQLGNSTIDYNNDTMNNGGIYGFIHAKDGQTPLTADQAVELKNRLVEMKASKEALGRIAGASAPLGFTQVSVDTDKMQPHTYSDAAQKHIANTLGWSTLLLNTDAKYDNLKAAWQMAISNRISPDLKIYEDGLNNQYYPKFKDLNNAEIHFDVSELPEMQGDMKAMSEWLATALENGAITPDEFRMALRYPATGLPEMEQHYLKTGVIPIEDVAVSDQSIARAFNLE